ncbi:hypothetical protein EG68_08008 [Paragonimus skrjabini miyazakii]|uniref:SCP domain-containing protein n=1 Tax=Paragonimus skrjabini miyazakii TaxID=59628 RepID=A0A8S9YQW6_9TREM|nr:hypothetical protein EG68_08008 [Paragonimus skrjabini miyazakii]
MSSGNLCIGLLILLVSGALSITEQDKQMLLQLHNAARAKILAGQVLGQPAAKYMPPMIWDDELAEKAQHWSNQCIAGHDSKFDRNTTRWSWVGQNFAGIKSVELGFTRWFEEYKSYNIYLPNCTGVCGHYTQVSTCISDSPGSF